MRSTRCAARRLPALETFGFVSAMNRLSIATRISHIYEAGGDTRVVDFMIDGSSIAERVRAIAPQQFQYSPAQAPFGNSDVILVGVTEWRALIDGDLFLTGKHPDFTGPYAGLLPLLVCSDCFCFHHPNQIVITGVIHF